MAPTTWDRKASHQDDTKQPSNPPTQTTNPSRKPSTKSWESWQVPFHEVISKHVQLDQHVSVLAKVRGKIGGQLGNGLNGLCRPGFVICWYGWSKVFWIQKRWNNAMILFVWSWHPSKKVLKYCLINVSSIFFGWFKLMLIGQRIGSNTSTNLVKVNL